MKTKKKLFLKKETVSIIDAKEMAVINGGANTVVNPAAGASCTEQFVSAVCIIKQLPVPVIATEIKQYTTYQSGQPVVHEANACIV